MHRSTCVRTYASVHKTESLYHPALRCPTYRVYKHVAQQVDAVVTLVMADSSMFKKMGNCLKFPVLRVSSSISVEKIFIPTAREMCLPVDNI